MAPNPKSLRVALHRQPAHDRRIADPHIDGLTARIEQLARDLRIQLVRIAQLQMEVDALRKKVG